MSNQKNKYAVYLSDVILAGGRFKIKKYLSTNYLRGSRYYLGQCSYDGGDYPVIIERNRHFGHMIDKFLDNKETGMSSDMCEERFFNSFLKDINADTNGMYTQLCQRGIVLLVSNILTSAGVFLLIPFLLFKWYNAEVLELSLRYAFLIIVSAIIIWLNFRIASLYCKVPRKYLKWR